MKSEARYYKRSGQQTKSDGKIDELGTEKYMDK